MPSFDKEDRRSSHRSPSSTPTTQAQERRSHRSPSHVPDKDVHERERERERERLPKNPRDDVPSSVCAMDMEFVARHQPSE